MTVTLIYRSRPPLDKSLTLNRLLVSEIWQHLPRLVPRGRPLSIAPFQLIDTCWTVSYVNPICQYVLVLNGDKIKWHFFKIIEVAKFKKVNFVILFVFLKFSIILRALYLHNNVYNLCNEDNSSNSYHKVNLSSNSEGLVDNWYIVNILKK